MDVRPYDPDRPGDADALYELKEAFETGLGEGTGTDDKAEKYAAKLTDDYRERYLHWVARCVDEEPRSVTVAQLPPSVCGGAKIFVGYVFVLPETLSMIWDAAVLNEIYVRPEHRGTGLADQLMEEALDVVRDQDLPLDRFVLDVDRGNERAQAFYEKYDFSHWGELVARDR